MVSQTTRKTRKPARRSPAAAITAEPGAWGVYILECADGTLYTGITNDLNRRVACHNAGEGARYTRARLPVRVRYFEPCFDRSAAGKRESAIKRLPRARKTALIKSAQGAG